MIRELDKEWGRIKLLPIQHDFLTFNARPNLQSSIATGSRDQWPKNSLSTTLFAHFQAGIALT